MLFWHVPAPDEALLISGSKHRDGATQFHVVTGHGSFVMPIKQKGRVLSLALREAELLEECVTTQGIPLKVRAVAVFKIGDDQVSIANAARRFLAEQDKMEELCGRIFAGHLRSIVGGLTPEEIISDRRSARRRSREPSPHRGGHQGPGGCREGAAGRSGEEPIRARHCRAARQDRSRGARGAGSCSPVRPVGRGKGVTGRHRRADLARRTPGGPHRQAARVRGSPPCRRRGLQAADAGRRCPRRHEGEHRGRIEQAADDG